MDGFTLSEGVPLENSLVYTLKYYTYDDYYGERANPWTSSEQKCINVDHYVCEITWTITDPEHYYFNDDENPGTGYEELWDLTSYVETRDWSITPAEIRVRVKNMTKFYSEPDPPLTYNVIGFAIGNQEPAFAGSLTREPKELGTALITQGTLHLIDNPETGFIASNYELVVEQGTLMIVADPIVPGS